MTQLKLNAYCFFSVLFIDLVLLVQLNSVIKTHEFDTNQTHFDYVQLPSQMNYNRVQSIFHSDSFDWLHQGHYLQVPQPQTRQPNPQSSLTPKTHKQRLGTSLHLHPRGSRRYFHYRSRVFSHDKYKLCLKSFVQVLYLVRLIGELIVCCHNFHYSSLCEHKGLKGGSISLYIYWQLLKRVWKLILTHIK